MLNLFFRLIVRLVALTISFIIATLCAALFITFALFLEGETRWVREDDLAAGSAFIFAMIAWFDIAMRSAAPAALVMLCLELGRFRSLIVNVLAGGAVALIALLAPFSTIEPVDGMSQHQFWSVALATGFTGGFVHWMIAGARSGNWLPVPRGGGTL